MKRRDFLAACAGLPLAACDWSRAATPAALPPGSLLDSGFASAHRLRGGGFPSPGETRRLPVLVVGAGIGGLSAGWALQRAGFADFEILELAASAGGNARYGENPVSAYPWGAHYLPLPTREAVFVRELLADLGALDGPPQAARPVYDERRLCHAPQERLYRDGLWQEGVIPQHGLTAAERAETLRFLERMAEFRTACDAQGRRAFALPMELSSPEPRWRALDRLSMADWLRDEGFAARPLLWYVDYACRDDFGTGLTATSAWAGIHYFACRNGEAANAPGDAVLTAPEGNGWIVRALAARLRGQLRPQALVFGVRQDRRRVHVDVWLADEARSVRYAVEQLVWAAPAFVLPHVAAELPADLLAACRAATYAPWLVANLTVREAPHGGAGAPLAWDNVLYGGAGLGYVVATHQSLRLRPGATVLSYYRPLADGDPRQARAALLASTREDWARAVLADLGRAHADLAALTTRLDVFRHGHAMIRPTPGSLWGNARRRLTSDWRRVRFAHADVSGMSLFEEANYRGVLAARRSLRALGGAVADEGTGA